VDSINGIIRYYYYPCYHIYAGNFQRIYETNHVSTVYSVAAVLYLQFVLHVIYYYYYYHHHRISHFSALAGKYSHILGCSNQQD